MNIAKFIIIVLLTLITASQIQSQTKTSDKGMFKENNDGFFGKILQGIEDFESSPEIMKKSFTMDFSNYKLPKSVDEFSSYWHNPPISQGNTSTCWSFSTTSYFESEIYRLTKKKVKLSEIYTVYWEYVEKAKGFVASRGESLFAEGSEANAVTRIWKTYGIVPEKDYIGLKEGQTFHNHSKMFYEMSNYLKSVKKENAWNEKTVTETIMSILNYYLGTPPTNVVVEGKSYSPKQYLDNYLTLKLDDYIDVLSYMQKPYYEKVEYEVPDNWWHSSDYYNIPLNEFMDVLKKAIRNGYTVGLGGDVSEPGKSAERDVFMVPDFDIPSEYIDENARQFRFSNQTTTDDHGIHLVGYLNNPNQNWYLIKDSGSGSRDGNNKGYYFFTEDYIKLKMMDYIVHKDALGDLIKKFK
ncbi:MAG: peptidase C1 [Ignavibacteriales bacterium]|nr:peptidase C1 [Ignavibacteriales bacterium]